MYLDRVKANTFCVGNLAGNSGARANTSLNAAYVHGTSGPAVAIRWMATTADPIDELYIFIDTNGGTLGSITMACDIYNEGASSSRAGTTLRDSSTATTMPGAVDQWIKFTFGTPYTPAVGEILWFVAYNTSASPTVDYPQILIGTNMLIGLYGAYGNTACGHTTTNGFSGNGTLAAETPFVIVHGTSYDAQPFTSCSQDTYTSNTRERGFVVTPTNNLSIYGVQFTTSGASSAVDKLKIYDNSTAPGGTALHSFDFDSDANETTGDLCSSKVFDAPITLTGGVTYKVVLSFGSSATLPHFFLIQDYATYASVFDSVRANNQLTAPWGCIDDGAGGWTIDKSICPGLYLLVDDQVAAAGGGSCRVIGGG